MSDEITEWITVDCDEDQAVALAEELKLPLPVARVLVSRGYGDADAARDFMNPQMSHLADPYKLEGIKVASKRVWDAINAGERITVFGDYDADGVTATALMLLVLKQLGAQVESYLPNRDDEGYGLSVNSLNSLVEATAPKVLITVDCGTSSHESIAVANKMGIDVIVTDHHECIEPALPDALAVINPKLKGDETVYHLAGVGVAFKLCMGLLKRGTQLKKSVVKDVDLEEYLDLVALGTVADVVPLVGENRILVRHGLAKINRVSRLGIQALIRAAGVRTKIDCYHLGFMIGPRINAAGRLTSADLALKLLLCDNPGQAKRLAGQLDSANRERKMIEDRIIENAVVEVEKDFDRDKTAGIVCAGEGWHIGTIGIVAARISGRYKRPAVVISFDENGMGRGSCRSIAAINVVQALSECSDLLERFGGHKLAAGLAIKKKNLAAFKKCFQKACCRQIKPSEIKEPHYIDSWLTIKEANQELLDAIEYLRPLGIGNQTPIWGARNMRVVGRPEIVGKNHLKLTFDDGTGRIEAIAFGMGDYHAKGNQDAVFQVQENTYMGRKSIQLNVRDLRPTEG